MLAIHGEERKNVYQRELELLWSESFNDFGWTCLSVVVCFSIGKAKPLFKVEKFLSAREEVSEEAKRDPGVEKFSFRRKQGDIGGD